MHINQQTILVVGGAGYIGSHMVLMLREAGFHVVVLDNLSKGHAEAVLDAELVIGDMGDKALLDRLFTQYQFSAVMHFASFIEVGESVKLPAKYYQNNLAATLNLLDAMLKANVKVFIFSSTAAVYGEPQYTPIDENHPLAPINPYGRSKWMVEEILKDYALSDALRFASLRYFNAAGADPKGRLGECHEPESHLIPLVLQVALGQRESINIYGHDYPTEDGTCIRDYVHIVDICQAHLLALNKLMNNEENIICNLGTGTGFSVKQVIETVENVTGRKIKVNVTEKRAGDPAVLVADASQAMTQLSWQPQYSELATIVQHAWQFARNNAC